MKFKSPIVITTETYYPQEVNWIIALFEAGLERLHLRKPQWDLQQCNALLNAIPVEYHKQIVVHQHHALASKFYLGGIHLREKDRNEIKIDLASYCRKQQQKGKTVSTSFHQLETVITKGDYFNYSFLSPVFDSTSKQGYAGKGFNVMNLAQTIVALGGITSTTITQTKALGYSGVAVLGGVWQHSSPLDAYLALQKSWKNQAYEN
ncbi:thiamine phosphate synthase [Croceivirga sp. JEA036]|uniref:thiamine phosphate synthase n=1 Tax=Croceivirga sp. JEA036 TaxID=2721162 RepID=UPI00143B04F1|nr:thiamine phosphate synthase [Croceivirga sp. JEA036]NJB35422.1 thiamine phosphate synthase [Croceivirga sp. JEA036]